MGANSRLGTSSLVEFVSDIVDNLCAKQTDIIRLEFSKAFNKVAHNRLLYKLVNYSIGGDTEVD